jgi:hypothetical protein
LTLLLAVGLILVALTLFLASATLPPAVTVEWSTASELNTAGFNVLRGTSENGPFTRLNREVIPASPDPLVGGTYVYTDTDVTPGQTYYYQLEEVEIGGGAWPQGTVVVTAPRNIEPIYIILVIGLATIFIIVLLWSERSRRSSPQP